MKKTSVIAFALLLCMMLSCCAPKVALRDDLDKGTLTEETAHAIVHSFNGSAIPAFSENEPLPYATAMNFFRHSGFYDLKGELREELSAYKAGKDYHIPADMVESFLTSKFDIQIDRRAPGVPYNKSQNCYTLSPAAPHNGKTEIDSVTEQADGSFLVVARHFPDPQNNVYYVMEQTFVIEYDGQYRFRSFSEKEKPFQELTEEEQRLVDIMEDYALLHLEFDEEAPLPFITALYYFTIFGFYEDGDIRKDLKPYATGGYSDPYRIPAELVEKELLARFVTEVDHAIEEYRDGFYFLRPDGTDYYYFYELVDCKKEGDVYTATVNERSCFDADYLETHRFVLQVTDTDYKYLAFSRI